MDYRLDRARSRFSSFLLADVPMTSVLMNKTRLSIVFALIVVLCAIYFFIDPASFQWAPKCPFRMLTGWDCPGCGSQRMLHSLLHGEFSEAWHHNALLMATIPLLIPMGYLEATRKRHPRLYMKVHSVRNIIIISAVIVGWFFYRNLFL